MVFVVGAPTQANAQQIKPLDDPNKGYVSVDNPETQGVDEGGVLTIHAIEGIVGNVLAVAISGIGFAGFVMMIVGSFQYLLSGGNSKGVEGGKNTLTYAIIGLIVSLSSWIILDFIARFTGVSTIKIFDICFGGVC